VFFGPSRLAATEGRYPMPLADPAVVKDLVDNRMNR